ncbi:DUF1737 domain-containing protein [Pontiellaceae bacterium B12219]|nr:DUF1737 domain-containing protein [Pontiellaceae bacterium B12219]
MSDKYMIAVSTNYAELSGNVNRLINQGWTPLGGVSVISTGSGALQVAQALSRK